MKKLRYIVLLVLIGLLVTGMAHAASPLFVDVITDGGCEGAFFDLKAETENLTITSFETVLVGTSPVQVYYKPGTYKGFELNPAPWILLGSQTITGGSGFIQTLYPLNVGGVTIPAGQTYGFLIHSNSGGGPGVLATRYHFGTPITVSDGALTFTGGAGDCGGNSLLPFDGFNADRVWRGKVYYQTAAASQPSQVTSETPKPGRDMVLIPDGSVMGKFVSATPLYYAPDFGALTYPTVTMDAGKTLWVTGIDEDSEFYQVLLSGTFYWVPVETMGPNDDALWQSHPLTVQIVEGSGASESVSGSNDAD